MFALIRRNPYAAVLSLLLHIAVVLLFFIQEKEIRFMDSAAPIESTQLVEPLEVVVSETVVMQKIAQAKARKLKQQQQIIGLKRKEDQDLQTLREEAEKEQKRLQEEREKIAKLEKQRKQAEADALLREETEKKELAEAKKRKEKEQAERKRLAAEKKKQDDAETKKRLAAEKKAKADKAKKLAAEKKRKAKEKAEREKREFAKALAERDAKVAATARKSGTSSSKNQKRDGTGSGGTSRKSAGGGGKQYNKYIGLIRSKIKRNWRRPAGIDDGLKSTLRVKLFPGGGVADVKIVRSSGDEVYDRSAQDAVFRADPLPVPNGKEFDNFRTLNLKFSPTGIN